MESVMQKNTRKTAYFHLPGLFEFYDFYRAFLPLFYEHREYFYDWCEIGSIYGAPADCLWGGGRVGYGDCDVEDALALVSRYGISARLTFSNSLLEKEHLADKKCNLLCKRLAGTPGENGVIIHSELLLKHLQKEYPKLYLVSSTTKVLTDFTELVAELERPEFAYVVADFRLNRDLDRLTELKQEQKEKLELLCNECCYIGCTERKKCYENVSRKALGLPCEDHICKAPGGEKGYRFSAAMENPAFISLDDIKNTYLPRGLSQFKIEGRSLGSAIILEFLLYYMTKPEYQLKVREEIYLDSMLDLF